MAKEFIEEIKLLKEKIDEIELRRNSITGQLECSLAEKPETAAVVTMHYGGGIQTSYQRCVFDSKMRNTFFLFLRIKGCGLPDADIKRYLASDLVPTYDPVEEYLEALPAWDKIDRVASVCNAISDNPVLVHAFAMWMRTMVAMWMGIEMQCSNSLFPILVSRRQGLRKTTFCRSILPPELRAYYSDSFNMHENRSFVNMTHTNCLINIDEFDQVASSPSKLALLKSILTSKDNPLRKLYTDTIENVQRRASFIGTSNVIDILNDKSGSRRYIIFEITKIIDIPEINYQQLYSQLVYEINAGAPLYLTREEEAEIEALNSRYSETDPADEVFRMCFRIPEGNEGRLYTSATIVDVIKKNCPRNSSFVKPKQLARKLHAMGVETVRRNDHNYFRLIEL